METGLKGTRRVKGICRGSGSQMDRESFLFFYGALALKSAFRNRILDIEKEEHASSLKKTVLLILALSLLNPHVYLDNVVLLGSIALQLPLFERIYFAIGAVLASFSWFFTITYGSNKLSIFLQSPKYWKVIDSIIALFMWAIAIMLIITI